VFCLEFEAKNADVKQMRMWSKKCVNILVKQLYVFGIYNFIKKIQWWRAFKSDVVPLPSFIVAFLIKSLMT
jgi:hypothetical protein